MLQERTDKNDSVHHCLVESLEAVPELDGKIALRILVDLALKFHQSIYHSSRIEMLGGFDSSSCHSATSPFLPKLSGSKKVSLCV